MKDTEKWLVEKGLVSAPERVVVRDLLAHKRKDDPVERAVAAVERKSR